MNSAAICPHDAPTMTPPAENPAFITVVTLAIIYFAVSALANRVICLTPQCMETAAIVYALTQQHE